MHLGRVAAARGEIIGITQRYYGGVEFHGGVGPDLRVAARGVHRHACVFDGGISVRNGSAACREEQRHCENRFCGMGEHERLQSIALVSDA
jgi:hypothetical protein